MLLGFPLARFITIEDSEEVLRAVQMTDDDVPIDLILHTPGGLVLASEQIANALIAQHRAKVTVFVRTLVERVLRGNGWEAERAAAVADAVTDGRWTHDYPITIDEAREIGLPVTTGVPDEVYRFMQLFPQTAARRPSVEYVPVPYPAPEPARPDGRVPG